MKKKCSRIVAISMIFIISSILLGLDFYNPVLILDTKNNIVYQNVKADTIIADFKGDEKSSKGKYKDNYYSVRGIITDKKDNNKQFTLASIGIKYDKYIRCVTSDKNIVNLVSNYNVGEVVDVYGKLSVDAIDKNIEITVANVLKPEKPELIRPITSYSLKDGTFMDSKNMTSRNLHEGKINFLIPNSWVDVEHNIKDENLGEIEGYQYCLNEIATAQAEEPENIFVFYFDNKLLKNANDKKQTDLIERAILCNILDKKTEKLEKFPLAKVTTYYGDKYQYYQDAYRKPLGEGYHTEFVFQSDGQDGIVVFLYLYKEETPHLNDIFFMMRLFNKQY